tara:strand:- start:505 stop:1023 length:519 start_codon:yes stop_codon:yes gene_type:complete
MKIKIYPIFLSIIFLIIFIIFLKGLQNSNIYVPNVNIEKDIPSFKTKIFDSNNEVSSKEIFKRDKFYLMNIWSSWCVPCREEHIFLMDLRNQPNIKIIGLNYKDEYKNAKKFLQMLDSPYETILLDKDGTIAIKWGAYGVPESFLIYNKKIIKKIVGPLNKTSLKEINNLIK